VKIGNIELSADSQGRVSTAECEHYQGIRESTYPGRPGQEHVGAALGCGYWRDRNKGKVADRLHGVDIATAAGEPDEGGGARNRQRSHRKVRHKCCKRDRIGQAQKNGIGLIEKADVNGITLEGSTAGVV